MPQNPVGIDDAVFRHYFQLGDNAQSLSDQCILYKYEFTYYMVFRGKRGLTVDHPPPTPSDKCQDMAPQETMYEEEIDDESDGEDELVLESEKA